MNKKFSLKSINVVKHQATKFILHFLVV